MKFCKNLQRVVEISDPEWAPYWTNYKMLKKIIKELPSLVPLDDGKGGLSTVRNGLVREDSSRDSIGKNTAATAASSSSVPANLQQHHGDKTGEISSTGTTTTTTAHQEIQNDRTGSPEPSSFNGNTATDNNGSTNTQDVETLGKSPGEIAFFKLLHTEFKKASHFFDRATEEFAIREERVREGMEIMRRPNSIMVSEKWSVMAKSIYRLYKDLLLLETFAIMTYCSFSKILKKHDKVTGYDTKNAFMANIVNKANFTNYPKVLAMIGRCETLYEEVSLNLLREGKEALYEDERLFINMIHRLNEQVLDSSDSEVHSERKQGASQWRGGSDKDKSQIPAQSDRESQATSSLRTLVEENAKASPAQVIAPKRKRSEGGVVSEEQNEGDDDDSEDGCGEQRTDSSLRIRGGGGGGNGDGDDGMLAQSSTMSKRRRTRLNRGEMIDRREELRVIVCPMTEIGN